MLDWNLDIYFHKARIISTINDLNFNWGQDDFGPGCGCDFLIAKVYFFLPGSYLLSAAASCGLFIGFFLTFKRTNIALS